MLRGLNERFRLFQIVDDYFCVAIPGEVLNVHCPSIISKESIRIHQYFTKFPNYLMAVAPVRAECHEEITRHNDINISDLSSDLQFLLPAGCLTIYPLLTQEDYIEDITVTSLSRVFRNENNYEAGIRLQEFHQREIVFIGQESYVKKQLEFLMSFALNAAQKIHPDSRSVEASDSFYLSPQNQIAARYQKVGKLKNEILVPIDGKEVACASINYHGTHFSKLFGFSRELPIVTGCVGFGIERWCTALQYHNGNVLWEELQDHCRKRNPD